MLHFVVMTFYGSCFCSEPIDNENAPDELKDLADWVAPSVEEHGFVVTMGYYGLTTF